MSYYAVDGRQSNIELPAAASEAIKPGMLIEEAAGEFQKHGTAAGVAELIVAGNLPDHDNLANFTTISTYDDGETVIGLRADKVKVWLAQSQTIAEGDPLESAGDGTVREKTTLDATAIVNSIVGYADEAVTTTSAEALIRIRKA